jgi:hypothetical protein
MSEDKGLLPIAGSHRFAEGHGGEQEFHDVSSGFIDGGGVLLKRSITVQSVHEIFLARTKGRNTVDARRSRQVVDAKVGHFGKSLPVICGTDYWVLGIEIEIERTGLVKIERLQFSHLNGERAEKVDANTHTFLIRCTCIIHLVGVIIVSIEPNVGRANTVACAHRDVGSAEDV